MSIATQIERLQGVRDQIRTKMVSLGLSENTDLLQNLADDLDGVNKVSPTNNGTTDPGSSYTNVDTLSRSTSTRYIKVPKGYNDADRKFTVSGVANGAYSASVASHTTTNASASSSVTGSITNVASTTKPSGTDGTSYYTITPKLTTGAGSSKATGKATVDTAGYLAAGNKSSSESSVDVGVTATQGGNYYLKAGSYSASVASHTTSNASASSSVTGSVTGIATTTKPSGTDGTDYYTITPKLATVAGSSKAKGKATVDAAGYLVTGNTTSSESSKTVGVTATQGGDYYLKAGKSSDVTSTVTASVSNITSINASQVTDGVTVTASASGSTVVPVGYYSTQVSKTPSSSKSTTIKPKLAGTSGAIELTAGTSAFTKTSTADYSNGFITSVKVNPTPSQSKVVTPTMAGQTVSPDAGKLLSSVTVNAVPFLSVTLSSGSWGSDSNVTIGKYYYNVSNANITASNNLYVIPSNASAAQSFGVYAYSQSRSSGASAGTLQFRAMENPTSDLTYTVYYLN